MQTYVRGLVAEEVRAAVAEAPPGSPIRFTASTEGVARDNLAIAADGWQLANYRANPVFLWAHDYGGQRPPIGRTARVAVEGGKVVCDVVFDQGDEFAREVERKYRAGFLSAVSVGWDTLEFEPTEAKDALGGGKVLKAELLDISAVPVPGDPRALMERAQRGLADDLRDLLGRLEPDTADDARRASERGRDLVGATDRAADWPEHWLPTSPRPAVRAAIPYKKTPLADRGAAWDANAEMTAATDAADYRAICAWVDAAADPDQRGSYKFPHHRAEGSHACVFAGCAGCMVRLYQANIPESDRKGVHTHVSRHYDDFGETAPEYRTYAEVAALGPREFRGLFLAGEAELVPDLFPPADTRTGSVLSARNRDDLEQAQRLIAGVLARATKADPAPQDDQERDRGPSPDHLGTLDGLAKLFEVSAA